LVLVAVAFFVAGCGGDQRGGPTATIVSDLPLQGPSRAENETIVNAVTLALEERDYMAGDVRIEYQSRDDARDGKWDETACEENAQSAAGDESIVGWIGPFNSGCATVQIPILNEAGLAMISPANTALKLTKPSVDPDEPEKYYPTGERNYARVIVTHDKQGRGGAIWMRDLGVESVFVLDDGETDGRTVANQFEQSARELGMEVLGREGVDGNAGDYSSLMQRIAQLNPDAIYFAGVAQDTTGRLVTDKVAAGMSNEDVLFMGPDGISDQTFLDAAGGAADGIYVTFGSLYPSELPARGQEFVDRYGERFGSDPEPYTANGYEAANVLLDAIERSYEADGEVTRAGVVQELFATQIYDGVLGTWSFDEDGDSDLTEISIQRVENGEFEFYRTIDIG
jgi:branched-chain amino acid transport system substrate-binding protein